MTSAPPEDSVCVRGPLRADLSGGYTDCSPLIDRMPSRMISAASTAFVTVSATRRRTSSISVDDSRGPVVRSGQRLARTLGQRTDLVGVLARGLLLTRIEARLQITVEAPLGSGLGTSGAITSCAMAALFRLAGLPTFDRATVAHTAAALERLAGHAGGLQDQFGCVTGGLTSYRFAAGHVDVGRLDHAADVLRGAILALPPPAERRSGSSHLVQVVTNRWRNGSRDTRAGITGLVALGDEMFHLLSADRPDRAAFHEAVLAVRDMQRLLHPEIRAAIDHSPFLTDLASHRIVAKPLGGAGVGAAWLMLGPCPESVRRRLRHLGWELRPFALHRTGLRTLRTAS